MEGHSPLVQQKYAPRLRHKVGNIIKNHIPHTPADNHSKGSVEDQIAYLLGCPTTVRLFGAAQTKPPSAHKPHKVHEPVPVDLHGAQGKGHRINVWITNHGCLELKS